MQRSRAITQEGVQGVAAAEKAVVGIITWAHTGDPAVEKTAAVIRARANDAAANKEERVQIRARLSGRQQRARRAKKLMHVPMTVMPPKCARQETL